MKTAFRRWWLSRKLRALLREIDVVNRERRNAVMAEHVLRRDAARVNNELIHLRIRGDRA